MRMARFNRLVLAGIASLAAPLVARAQDIAAETPFDLSVTVYRDPYRSEGGFDLDDLQGFALITEFRRVKIPAGEHRLRFEGVADGIDPASAIVTGLPSGVIEKNRDTALLSPSALVDAAATDGGRVQLARTNPATGATVRTEGIIRSGADGVVFEGPDGIEALRCSGLPETFDFQASTTGLSAVPTMSVLTRAAEPVDAVVQLSYLARGFDWSADYVVDMADTGRTFDLGAWITLANGNGVSFKDARVQIVAGRLNRETDEIEPIVLGQPILARCWPRGSTSDRGQPMHIERAFPLGFDPSVADAVTAITAELRDELGLTTAQDYANFAPGLSYSPEAKRVSQEDLGDLKLYRIPDRTTVLSRQSKQVRMMDRDQIPFAKFYEADFPAGDSTEFDPMTAVLRTKNDVDNHLGLPLPSGRVSVFESADHGAGTTRLLAGETGLRDIAIDEETELRLPGGPGIQARQVRESATKAGPTVAPPRTLKGERLRDNFRFMGVNRIELTNDRPLAINAEVRLYLQQEERIVRSDLVPEQKNGRPIFRVTVPANDSLTIRYQTARPR